MPPWHPYFPPVEWQADLDRIRATDVLAFLRTWYQPSNATLAIAGAFDPAKAVDLVNRYFGGLPSVAPPRRQALPSWSNEHVWLRVAAVQPHDLIEVAWHTPAYCTEDDAALDLVSTVLAGPGNTRLGPQLVATRLAMRVSAREASSRASSLFAIDIEPAPSVDLQAVMNTTRDTIAELARSVTDVEVRRAKAVRADSTLLSLETVQARAMRLAHSRASGCPEGPDDHWGLDRYANIGPAEVSRAAATWLAKERRVVTVVFADSRYPPRGMVLERTVIPR